MVKMYPDGYQMKFYIRQQKQQHVSVKQRSLWDMLLMNRAWQWEKETEISQR